MREQALESFPSLPFSFRIYVYGKCACVLCVHMCVWIHGVCRAHVHIWEYMQRPEVDHCLPIHQVSVSQLNPELADRVSLAS